MPCPILHTLWQEKSPPLHSPCVGKRTKAGGGNSILTKETHVDRGGTAPEAVGSPQYKTQIEETPYSRRPLAIFNNS